MRTSTYRYYDRDGKVIYIGITGAGALRQTQHNRTADWWPFVATQDVEHVDTRGEALRREKALIERFRPPFNREHNPGWERLRASYLAHVEVEQGPHAGPLECSWGNPETCYAFEPTVNAEHWCGKPQCPVCHERWHGHMQGFEDGGENEQKVVREDLAALCAAEDDAVREVGLAARAALQALVETVGDSRSYDLLVSAIRPLVPSDAEILEILDDHERRRLNPPVPFDPTAEVPF